MIGEIQKNIQMKVLEVPVNIGEGTADLDSEETGGHQGVMLCQEMTTSDGHDGELVGRSYNPSDVKYKWLVLVPKYLSDTCGVTGDDIPSQETVSPPYKKGEIIYCARLDLPVAMTSFKNSSDVTFANTHPSLSGGRWSKIFNLRAVRNHYGLASLNPINQMVFWIDLNVDGRSRVKTSGDSGGTSGTAQNVWL